LHLTTFDRRGRLLRHRVDLLPRFSYMHDWFITERHVVFHFQPLFIAFWGFLFGRRSMADSLRWRPEEGTLLLVYEREGDGDPLRLIADPCFMWHSLNACERNGELHADFIGYDAPDHLIGEDPVIRALMRGAPGSFESPGVLRRHVIDPARQTVRTERLDSGSYEWPFVNRRRCGHPYRIAYTAQARDGEFFWTMVTRIDMASGRTATHDFGPGVYCSEPLFVPRPGADVPPESAEEPGWLLTEGYDSRTAKGFLAVLDADHPEDGPMATVRLEHHVPFSFHGFWCPGPHDDR
jgi:all-trans-8'-apo-beta-carotenal 15,15'-oxygenase